MNLFINLFKKIKSFFIKKSPSADYNKIEVRVGELIEPTRFKWAQEEYHFLMRSEEESLELFEIIKGLDKEKQESTAKTTKDTIIQKKILETFGEDIICSLALNPWLSEECQYIMVNDEKFNTLKIKAALARKINLTLDVQKVLAKDPAVQIRRMLVRWQRPLNPAIATILVNDPDLEVRKTIASNMGEVIKHDNVICFKDKGNNTFKMLVEDSDSEVRACLSQNKNIGKENIIRLAEKCSKSGEWGIISLLAENESISPEVEKEVISLLDLYANRFTKESVIRKLKKNKGLVEKKKLLEKI